MSLRVSVIKTIFYTPAMLAQLENAWQKAAEFGVLAFVLIFILTGVGLTLWKLGSRLTDATTDSLRRQADAGEKTADAVMKIGDLTAAIQVQNEQAARSMTELAQQVHNTAMAMQHLIDAVHELTPDDQVRVRDYLKNARQKLES